MQFLVLFAEKKGSARNIFVEIMSDYEIPPDKPSDHSPPYVPIHYTPPPPPPPTLPPL